MGRVKRFFNFDRHFSNLISRGFISSYLWRCLGVPTSTIGWKREKFLGKKRIETYINLRGLTSINIEEQKWLQIQFEEVFGCIRICASDKAQGPDGFSMCFY